MGRKYNCNYNYFKEIDTEDKAYWLGGFYTQMEVFIKQNTQWI